MENKLTVYKNELNIVPFRKFNSLEMDLFFSICTQMRDKGLHKIQYSFEQLKNLSNYKDRHSKRFINDLEQVYKKMLQLSYRQEDSDEIKYFVLFNSFIINKTNEYVEISVNPELEYIINEISGGFTKFELSEFTNIRSSYAKTAFRLLKQFRQTGFWRVKIIDFRNILDVPKTYNMDALTKRVLNPIQKELSSIFFNLKIIKIKSKKRNKIEYLEFSFKPQDDIRKDGTKIFKDNYGNYYENDIEHFSKEEVNKIFPNE